MAQANQSNVRFLIFILEPGVTQHISIHMLPSLLKKLESPELTQLKSLILLVSRNFTFIQPQPRFTLILLHPKPKTPLSYLFITSI